MNGATAKEKIRQVFEDLPADASFEDAMERLYILYKVERGRQQLGSGAGIPHEEVKKQLKRWQE